MGDIVMTKVYSWEDVELFVEATLPHLELIILEEKEFFPFFNDMLQRPIEEDKHLFDLIRHIVDVFHCAFIGDDGDVETYSEDDPELAKEDLIRELSEFETKFKAFNWGERLIDRVINCYYNFKRCSQFEDATNAIMELYE